MEWDGKPVKLAASSDEADSDPRFYKTDSGIYFEVTSPGGGDDVTSLRRSIKITVPLAPNISQKRRKILLDINGNFGRVTVGSKKVAGKSSVTVPYLGRNYETVELHGVEGKTWGWVSTPDAQIER